MIDIDFSLTAVDGRRRFELQVRLATEAAVTALYGPSGAGKSLTLQAVAGLLRPARGHIRMAVPLFAPYVLTEYENARQDSTNPDSMLSLDVMRENRAPEPEVRSESDPGPEPLQEAPSRHQRDPARRHPQGGPLPPGR